MSAFRDASAAIERAAMLEQENEQLRLELAELAKLRVEVEELAKLRAEVDALRRIARTENDFAYLSRLSEERMELAKEVRALRDRLAAQEGELTGLRRAAKLQRAARGELEPFLERVLAVFRRR